jgi:3-oxoacyl-[acyl-carrier protein] reductase
MAIAASPAHSGALKNPHLQKTIMTAQHLLTDQTIIVTGAATGIGQAFALGAAAQGAHVLVADMHDADMTMDQIAKAGGRATYAKVDVSNDVSVKAMVDTALKATGRIDGLINNAAYFREVKLTPFEELDPDQWDRIFQVNVKGIWLCCKAVMPAMRERQRGSIVNIASVVAVAGQPGYLHYVATKGAVLSMTKGLAKECGKDSVRCNVIAPGFVETDMTASLDEKRREEIGKSVPLGRFCSAQEIAAVVKFVASKEAGYITGALIPVDGGLGMGH